MIAAKESAGGKHQSDNRTLPLTDTEQLEHWSCVRCFRTFIAMNREAELEIAPASDLRYSNATRASLVVEIWLGEEEAKGGILKTDKNGRSQPIKIRLHRLLGETRASAQAHFWNMPSRPSG